jgi:phosphohistidine phosphatase
MMPENIILWRHAEAKDALASGDIAHSDMQRALTEKGQRQAEEMAEWLKSHLPKNILLQCSPALRAFQTADALGHEINIHQALKPGASLSAVLASLTQINAQTNVQGSLVIVGHQPWLGQLAAHLLGHADAELAIKKGAIWWLRLDKNGAINRKGTAQYNIHTVQTPSLL